MISQVNKKAVAKAFSRAASHYDLHSELQCISGDRLITLAPPDFGPHVLDAGCGTGRYSRYWGDNGRTVTALDLSEHMLDTSRRNNAAHHYLQGDIDHLPLIDNCVDGVWSNLAVQWSDNLHIVLQNFLRITRPGGKVLFSTILNGSLQEVHQSWAEIDKLNHANYFLSEDEVVTAINNSSAIIHTQYITLHFPSALSAMQSLKGVGATHLNSGRERLVLTRTKLQQLEKIWPQDEEGYRLTYHLIYGVLTK